MNESPVAPSTNPPVVVPLTPAPATIPPATPPYSPTKTHKLLFAGIGITIICLLGLLAWLVTHTNTTSAPTTTPVPTSTSPVTTPVTTTTSAILNGEDPTVANLDIAWRLGRIVDPAMVFPGKGIVSDVTRLNQGSSEGIASTDGIPTFNYHYAFYEHGSVKSGPYAGQTVYTAVQTSKDEYVMVMGMDITPAPVSFTLLADANGLLRAVNRTRADLFPEWKNSMVSAPNLRLTLSEFPAQLLLKNGKVLTKRGDRQFTGIAGALQPLCNSTECLDRLPLAETTDGKKLFAGPLDANFLGTIGTGSGNDPLQPGCLILYREDGTSAIYESVIPSTPVSPVTDEARYQAPLVGSADLRWDPPYFTTSSFRTHLVGGCGGWTCAEIAANTNTPDSILESDLVRAGQTIAGDPLYVFKTAMNPRTQDYFGPIKKAYDGWWDIDPATQQKSSVETFLQRYPVAVFLWKDALGRWTVYQNTAAAPLAECGKPVIYLYPTQTTKVHVQLPSFIQLTKSEPSYPSTGWNVEATPTGQLTQISDNSIWSSLFWEGTGVSYPTPTTGFVVKQSDVPSFLLTTLAKYGLNDKETQDFMDFWVPEMQAAPYYRVSFLTDTWDQLVPLSVQPKPSQQIRLFMDWQKLTAPISLPEPTIKTPVRAGFTLVEWGGLLRK